MIVELYSGYHTEMGRAFQAKDSVWAEAWRHVSLVRGRGLGENGDTHTRTGLSISCRLCPGALGSRPGARDGQLCDSRSNSSYLTGMDNGQKRVGLLEAKRSLRSCCRGQLGGEGKGPMKTMALARWKSQRRGPRSGCLV